MDTHGDVGCVPILLHSHFWIWFPTLILYVKKQHKKRHHQSTLLVTKEAGPKATGFGKKRLHCSESRSREGHLPGSQPEQLGFQKRQQRLFYEHNEMSGGGGGFAPTMAW